MNLKAYKRVEQAKYVVPDRPGGGIGGDFGSGGGADIGRVLGGRNYPQRPTRGGPSISLGGRNARSRSVPREVLRIPTLGQPTVTIKTPPFNPAINQTRQVPLNDGPLFQSTDLDQASRFPKGPVMGPAPQPAKIVGTTKETTDVGILGDILDFGKDLGGDYLKYKLGGASLVDVARANNPPPFYSMPTTGGYPRSSFPSNIGGLQPVLNLGEGYDIASGPSMPADCGVRYLWDPVKDKWIKRSRRRRKRLATKSDLNDLAALSGILGKGKAFEVWIATH